jgi:hypothetical protein
MPTSKNGKLVLQTSAGTVLVNAPGLDVTLTEPNLFLQQLNGCEGLQVDNYCAAYANFACRAVTQNVQGEITNSKSKTDERG